MSNFIFICFLYIFLSPLPIYAAAQHTEFVVSPSGSDRNPGSIDKPFASLEHARDAIRELKQKNKSPLGGVTVLLRGGTYNLSTTFELTEKDSGTEKSPITYRPYKNENVHLTGGKELNGFVPVTDAKILKRLDAAARGKVVQVDLKALGITDFGEMKPRGFARSGIQAALELFYKNKPMTLARWPNNGWEKILTTPAGHTGGRFQYSGNRPERWAEADDIWLHGYWTWDWADSFVKVAKINTQVHEIATQEPHGVYGYKSGGRYYALNILEELDEAGEWYLDRKTGLLYFWPPAPLKRNSAAVSLLATVVSLRNVSHVTFRGMTIEQCRGTAVTISGGSDNRLLGCTIRNAGNEAVKIEGGLRNGVQSCDIYQCGDGGIILSGGDRKTLTAAGNYAVNNRIHDFSHWVRTYNPAIAINGVGNRIANNLIYNAPHSAIILHGNDHIIEYNEIHHVCMDTSDAGAFYIGRDYSERGNIVRFNYFHELGKADVQAIYLDDFASGTTVYGNVVYKAGRGVLIGGGRDNVIQNNVFAECSKHSVHLDARGLGWARKFFDGSNTTLTDRLKAVNHLQPPYSVRYPRLVSLYNGNPAQPEGNVISNNISYRGTWLDLANGLTSKDLTLDGNLIDGDPGFVDYPRQNFKLKADSPAFLMGFKRIPLEKIGIYRDEYRP